MMNKLIVFLHLYTCVKMPLRSYIVHRSRSIVRNLDSENILEFYKPFVNFFRYNKSLPERVHAKTLHIDLQYRKGVLIDEGKEETIVSLSIDDPYIYLEGFPDYLQLIVPIEVFLKEYPEYNEEYQLFLSQKKDFV